MFEDTSRSGPSAGPPQTVLAVAVVVERHTELNQTERRPERRELREMSERGVVLYFVAVVVCGTMVCASRECHHKPCGTGGMATRCTTDKHSGVMLAFDMASETWPAVRWFIVFIFVKNETRMRPITEYASISGGDGLVSHSKLPNHRARKIYTRVQQSNHVQEPHIENDAWGQCVIKWCRSRWPVLDSHGRRQHRSSSGTGHIPLIKYGTWGSWEHRLDPPESKRNG